MKLSDLERRLNKLGLEIQANVEDRVVETATSVLTAVTFATPVDTGRARANWLVSTGAPVRGTVEPIKGSKGSTGAANAQQAITRGKAKLIAQKPSVVYISNNLPYIARLNEGYSAQAPSGFVERSVIAGVRAVRKKPVTRRR